MKFKNKVYLPNEEWRSKYLWEAEKQKLFQLTEKEQLKQEYLDDTGDSSFVSNDANYSHFPSRWLKKMNVTTISKQTYTIPVGFCSLHLI